LSNTNRYDKWYETLAGKEITTKKYFHDGENFNGFVRRVSGIFSSATQSLMDSAVKNADFFPAGRSLYGAGSKGKFKATMSNCYIMPMPEDNIESIFQVAKETARIFSYGGGAGINLSKLRPKGALVNNSARSSTGACSFMEIYDSIGNVIGANNRRAALILGLNCDHPDIEEFLNIKQNDDKIQSANISILFTDDFMKAVIDDGVYELSFDIPETDEKITKLIKARDFFIKFAESNHAWAEPGCLFLDTIRKHNYLSAYPEDKYKIDISNPCAEYLGNAYNSCNLGSVNLYNMVKNPFSTNPQIDWLALAEAVHLGVIALDEILDYGKSMQPLSENADCIDKWRAIGLGVFGLADMLIALGVTYGSQKSIEIVDKVMNFIQCNALEASMYLAQTKGTFTEYNWDYISKSPLIKKYKDTTLYSQIKQYGLRNASILSIAPTGSISTMCGISGGVEPLFAISYERTTHALSNEKKFFKVYGKSVEHLLKVNGINPDSITNEEIKKKFPYVVTAHDISYRDRINVQATMQKYVDNAISSTINLPHEASVEDVYNAYTLAWSKGCKGLTIFRDGCERTAILTIGTKSEVNMFDKIKPIKSASLGRVEGEKIVKHTACVKNLYNHVYCNEEGNVVEVFTSTSQGCASNIGTITRLASLALRSGVKVEEVIAEMKVNLCPACAVLKQQGQRDISNSCGNAIAEAIQEVYRKTTTATEPIKEKLLECPECGEKTLKPEGRCFTCTNCMYSKCE